MSETHPDLTRLMRLVDEAQEELHRADVRLSAVVSKAARVARLRGDLENLYWLEMELHPIGGQTPRSHIETALAQRYGKDWSDFRVATAAQYFKRRELAPDPGKAEGLICGLSVGQIEAQVEWLRETVAGLAVVQDLTEQRIESQISARDLALVQEKVRAHVATFLSTTEAQLLVGEAASDIFKFVNRLLQFASDRISGSGIESLMSVRLEDLAGRLDAINSLSSKGVHADVSDFEVNQCVIQTYLLVGDLLHLRPAGE